MKNKKKLTIKIILYVVVRLILLASFIVSLLSKNYYTAFQCVLVLLLFMMPTFINAKFKLSMPNFLEILIILFIFSSVFLGEIRDFYTKYTYWDGRLHIISGFIMSGIGLSLTNILNKSERVPFMLSPFFVALFSFCFSMTIGVLWEFFEYGADMLLHFDMQKDTYITTITSQLINSGVTLPIESVTVNGNPLPGYIDIGLIDTMQDLLVNALGALVLSIAGWFYLKGKGNHWIRELMLHKKHDHH